MSDVPHALPAARNPRKSALVDVEVEMEMLQNMQICALYLVG